MFVTFIQPARARMVGKTGEVHFSEKNDVVQRLSTDAIQPLVGSERTASVELAEVSDEDMNTLARMFGENGWWVCWCDE